MRSVILIPLLIALAACVETRFESIPGDAVEACDERWKGLWVYRAGPDEREDDELAFLVDEECRFQLLERPEKDGPPKAVHIPLNFVRGNGADYVVIADDQLSPVVDVRPVHGIDPPPAKAFFIARYRIDGDRLEIDAIDDRRVARLVIDNELSGTVDRSRNELHVFVRGDRARVLEILRTQPVFVDKPGATLERRQQTLAEFERERTRSRGQDR